MLNSQLIFSCGYCYHIDGDSYFSLNPIRKTFTISEMDRFRDLLQRFFEFSVTTSIHGFRYVGDESRHVTSRIVWFVAVAISFACAAWIIVKSTTGQIKW